MSLIKVDQEVLETRLCIIHDLEKVMELPLGISYKMIDVIVHQVKMSYSVKVGEYVIH